MLLSIATDLSQREIDPGDPDRQRAPAPRVCWSRFDSPAYAFECKSRQVKSDLIRRTARWPGHQTGEHLVTRVGPTLDFRARLWLNDA